MISALALGACDRTTQTAANFNAVTNSAGTPSMFIAAPSAKVQQVIISRAAAKGSIIKPSGNGRLVLERPISGTPSPQVVAACGDSWFGRKVRVVMSLQAQNGGTQITENRYIVGMSPMGGDCAMPLTQDDYNQSMNAMSAVKAEAEQQ
ncbi:MAG: hypothetical protein V4691_08385 [Pseudomonadota bacterium]